MAIAILIFFQETTTDNITFIEAETGSQLNKNPIFMKKNDILFINKKGDK